MTCHDSSISDGLGLADVSSNPVFCLNPPWLFGVDLELARQANQKALAPRIEAYAPRSSVIAYTDGSLPHHGKDRGAGGAPMFCVKLFSAPERHRAIRPGSWRTGL